MQVKGCRVRDLNPHTHNPVNCGNAGRGAESEHLYATSQPAEAPRSLPTVPRGNRKATAMMIDAVVYDDARAATAILAHYTGTVTRIPRLRAGASVHELLRQRKTDQRPAC